jgi:hypothetical protein
VEGYAVALVGNTAFEEMPLEFPGDIESAEEPESVGGTDFADIAPGIGSTYLECWSSR